MKAPCVFIIRHGDTEWSRDGRHTGITDIPLLVTGEDHVRDLGKGLVGEDKLISPSKLAHIYVSPRQRALRTLKLLGLDSDIRNIEVTETIREWDYGKFEGLTDKQVEERRGTAGINGDWSIWKEGCPGGESPQDVTKRLDGLIDDIRKRFHTSNKPESATHDTKSDVLIVAHGHILTALAMRWKGETLGDGKIEQLKPGGYAVLSYEGDRMDKPTSTVGKEISS